MVEIGIKVDTKILNNQAENRPKVDGKETRTQKDWYADKVRILQSHICWYKC